MKKLLFSLLSLLMVCGLAWADGVKISGKVTANGWSSTFKESYAELLNSEGALVEKKALVMDGDIRAYTYEFTEVQSGEYQLRITAFAGNGSCYRKTEAVSVASVDIEKDVVLELDGSIVTMFVQPQYQGTYGPAALYEVEVTCLKKGTSESETKTTPAGGDPRAAFYCDTVSTYVVTLHKAGYEDTTIETKAWADNGHGTMASVSLTILMKDAAPADPQVTLNGAIQIKDHANDTLDKLGTFYLRALYGEGKSQDIQIEKGRYEFDNPIPVGEIVYQLCIRDASYYVVPAKNWVFESSNFDTLAYTLAGEDNATVTNNLTVVRVATDITGKVVEAQNNSNSLGGVKVKISNAAGYADSTNTIYNGDFSFSGIKDGTYTLTFIQSGYTADPKEITVSIASMKLDSVMQLGNIEMAALAQEYTFSGKAGIRKGSENKPLKDVVVELWSSAPSEQGGYKKVELKDSDTTDAEGNWTLVYSGFANDLLYLVAKHDSIETEETMSSANSFSSQSQAGYLSLYGQPRLPELYGMVNCHATQDAQAATPTVNLTWEWPQALIGGYVDENGEGTYRISRISIFRDTKNQQVKVGDTSFVGYSLPITSFVDSNSQYPLVVDSVYTYRFAVEYAYGKPASKTVEVNDSANLTVKIAAKPVDPVKEFFNLKLQVNDTTMGKVEGEGRYEKGKEVTIKAIAKEGYVFEAWKTENGETEISKLAEYSFVLSSDSTLKAFFVVKPVDPVKEFFNLKLQVNDTTMGKVEGEGRYEKGKEVTIKAIAKEGYVFEAWKAGETEISKETECKITLVSDSTLKAFFVVKPVDPVKDSFELTLDCDATMGSVEGAGKYEKGTEVPVKATANEGYVFVAWMSGNDTVAKTAEHKITLVSDSTLTAVFAKKTANEDREQAAWNVYVEGQTIVLQSNAACQYDVYNLTGALVKRAKTNANEYRIAVNNSGLYIIRRISATGTSVKKVMVR